MKHELHEAIVDEDVLRPTHVEVDLGRIGSNLETIVQHVGRPAMPILKANAYGHGLVAVAQTMEAKGVPAIGLAYLEEAIRVRRAGVTCPLLVLGGIVGDQIPLFLHHNIWLTASSVDKLRAIDDVAGAMGKEAVVHLKVDTGMERIGVHWYHAEKLLEASLACRNITVHGIFSHLACSDEADPGFTERQVARFEEVLSFYARRSLPPPVRHLANSAAIVRFPNTWYDWVRPGILLFGVYPGPDVPRWVAVKPAATWKTRVVYFKVVRAGDPVSYGATWAPQQMTRLVTLPVGYGDGYFRALSNRAEVLIHGKRYPVVGRVCMDQVMVDIGWDTAFNGDEVVLLGRQGDEGIDAEQLATWASTIPYEVLTSINTRVPRVFV